MTSMVSSRAPYPGLRAFRRDETDLFFGRDDCVNAMVDRLAATRFLAVLGSSGSGKSSMVNTGLLDALERGLIAGAGSSWQIVDVRPGGAPFRNLARRLLETEEGTAEAPFSQESIELLRAFCARGPRSIIEWCQGHLPQGSNLLLLVDQFEELFRYENYAGREETEAFIALLLESAQAREVPLYVTLTMTAGYLGACTSMPDLAEAISTGMYLTPSFTRAQLREAIVGPAQVCGIEIEDALINRLLNDLANPIPDEIDEQHQLSRLARRLDQLPLMQHALRWLWQRSAYKTYDEPVRLTISDYEAIGRVQRSLDAHAEEVLATLDPQHLSTAEMAFRTLTAGTTPADAVRRPARMGELAAVCSDEAAVRMVLDAFRAPGCDFLLPESSTPLTPDTIIDISHESLIRQWRRLSYWLRTEAEAAQQWRRLRDRQIIDEPLTGRELANAVAWREVFRPNAAWAQRYGGNYATVMALLHKSMRTRRLRLMVMAAVFSAIAILLMMYVYQGAISR